MGNIINRNDIPDTLDPAFSIVHDAKKRAAITEYDKVFQILTSEKQQEKQSSMTDMTNAVEKPEGADMTPAVYMQKYDETWLHTTFGLSSRITKEAFDDDLSSGKLKRIPALLFDSALNCVESKTSDIFDTAGSVNGPDIVPLLSESHPTPLSGTLFSNTPAAPVALTVGSLESSILRQEQTLTDSGNPMFLTVKNLLIQTANLFNARKILNSINTPFEQSNTKNVLQEYNIQLIVWKYLSNTTCWFTLCSKELLQFYFYWRERINKSWMAAPDTSRDALYMIAMRFSCDYLDWRGVDGSMGA